MRQHIAAGLVAWGGAAYLAGTAVAAGVQPTGAAAGVGALLLAILGFVFLATAGEIEDHQEAVRA